MLMVYGIKARLESCDPQMSLNGNSDLVTLLLLFSCQFVPSQLRRFPTELSWQPVILSILSRGRTESHIWKSDMLPIVLLMLKSSALPHPTETLPKVGLKSLNIFTTFSWSLRSILVSAFSTKIIRPSSKSRLRQIWRQTPRLMVAERYKK